MFDEMIAGAFGTLIARAIESAANALWQRMNDPVPGDDVWLAAHSDGTVLPTNRYEQTAPGPYVAVTFDQYSTYSAEPIGHQIDLVILTDTQAGQSVVYTMPPRPRIPLEVRLRAGVAYDVLGARVNLPAPSLEAAPLHAAAKLGTTDVELLADDTWRLPEPIEDYMHWEPVVWDDSGHGELIFLGREDDPDLPWTFGALVGAEG